MYVRDEFKPSEELAIDLIREQGFGLLMSFEQSRPIGSHIPLMINKRTDSQILIEGHLARANSQWQTLDSDAPVLCVFTGPHSYVSSQWYNFVNVPTWNYAVVHVYGRSRLIHDKEQFREHLKKMMDLHESRSRTPHFFDQLPDGYVDKYMSAIVGFLIEVVEIEANFKLSQDKDAVNYRSIVEHLEARNEGQDRLVATLMRRIRPDVMI
jgi:transcriptional regulator